MKSLEDARILAETMVQLGERGGRQVVCLLSDMEQPLGWAIGNALEIDEARATLAGSAPPDFYALVVRAAGRLLALSDLGLTPEEGIERAEAALADGSALAAYERWIRAQGGDPSENVLPRAPVVREVLFESSGFVTHVSAIGFGRLALELGAGRRAQGDTVDHAVGIRCWAKIGDTVEAGQSLAEIHARDEAAADDAAQRVAGLVTVADAPPPPRPIILETIE
jgi:thymidine phosphorylase